MMGDSQLMRDVAKLDETDFVLCPNNPGSFLANDVLLF
jgi:hypothetical protein